MIVFKSKTDMASYREYMRSFIRSFARTFVMLGVCALVSVLALAFYRDDELMSELNIAFITLLGVILVLTIISYIKSNTSANLRLKYCSSFVDKSEIVEIDPSGVKKREEFSEQNSIFFQLPLISYVSKEKSGLYVISLNNGNFVFFKPTQFVTGSGEELDAFFSSNGINFKRRDLKKNGKSVK